MWKSFWVWLNFLRLLICLLLNFLGSHDQMCLAPNLKFWHSSKQPQAPQPTSVISSSGIVTETSERMWVGEGLRVENPNKSNQERNWGWMAAMDWRVNWYQITPALLGSVSPLLILLTTDTVNVVSVCPGNQLKLNPLMENNPIFTVSPF